MAVHNHILVNNSPGRYGPTKSKIIRPTIFITFTDNQVSGVEGVDAYHLRDVFKGEEPNLFSFKHNISPALWVTSQSVAGLLRKGRIDPTKVPDSFYRSIPEEGFWKLNANLFGTDAEFDMGIASIRDFEQVIRSNLRGLVVTTGPNQTANLEIELKYKVLYIFFINFFYSLSNPNLLSLSLYLSLSLSLSLCRHLLCRICQPNTLSSGMRSSLPSAEDNILRYLG